MIIIILFRNPHTQLIYLPFLAKTTNQNPRESQIHTQTLFHSSIHPIKRKSNSEYKIKSFTNHNSSKLTHTKNKGKEITFLRWSCCIFPPNLPKPKPHQQKNIQLKNAKPNKQKEILFWPLEINQRSRRISETFLFFSLKSFRKLATFSPSTPAPDHKRTVPKPSQILRPTTTT